jgi:hypothetical protein
LRHWAAVCLLGILLPGSALAQAAGSGTVALGSDQAALGGSPAQGTETTVLPQVTVITPTPPLSSGADRSKLPAQNQVLASKDPPGLSQGFGASSLRGVPQVMAAYVNGVRFNNPLPPFPEAPP